MGTDRGRAAVFFGLALERQGFVEALRDHVAMFAERTELVAPLRMCGEPRTLPPDVEQAAFRIIQEALTNVEKHAHAASATVELDFSAGRLRCVVADDGRATIPRPSPQRRRRMGASASAACASARPRWVAR